MQVDVNEIAQKLNLSIEQVNASNALKNTFYKVKNDASLTEEDRESIYKEISTMFKGMLGSKKIQ